MAADAPPPPPRNTHAQLDRQRPQIAILDFGSQFSHLIARRVREANVYCELYSCLVEASVLESKQVVGVILSGGPASVYEAGAPHVSEGVWQLIERAKLPVLGICYGMQELARHFEKSPPGHGPQSILHLGNREALRLGKKEEDNLSLTKVTFL